MTPIANSTQRKAPVSLTISLRRAARLATFTRRVRRGEISLAKYTDGQLGDLHNRLDRLHTHATNGSLWVCRLATPHQARAIAKLGSLAWELRAAVVAEGEYREYSSGQPAEVDFPSDVTCFDFEAQEDLRLHDELFPNGYC